MEDESRAGEEAVEVLRKRLDWNKVSGKESHLAGRPAVRAKESNWEREILPA